MKNNDIQKEIEGLVNEIKRNKKVIGIVLFGSFAKGKTKQMSDVDIAVITKNHEKKLEAEIFGFSSDYFDVVNFHLLPLYIQFEVLKYGKVLFLRNELYFNEIKRNVLRQFLEMGYFYKRMSERILT